MAESSVNGATSVPQTPKPDMDANYEPLSQQQSSANSDMDVDDKAGMIPSEYFNSGANTPTVAVQELSQDATQRQNRLKFLLEKSGVYAKLIGDRMEKQRDKRVEAEARAAARREKKDIKAALTGGNNVRHAARLSVKKEKEAQPLSVAGGKRKRTAGRQKNIKEEFIKEEDLGGDIGNLAESGIAAGPSDIGGSSAHAGMDNSEDIKPNAEYHGEQPALITGATLKSYQLAGVQWMVSLYENGLNGILADEMGLGKTIQTISFICHLMNNNAHGPFLIVCPLSVLANWVNEFNRFAPEVPVLMYHGSPPERAELRATRMKADLLATPVSKKKAISGGTGTIPSFPVIVTTYEMIIKDQRFLSRYAWKFIVVDEGHRLKNLNSKIIRELKTYQSANRLLLTGTPLHNNLSELWSLLNFIMPDIFDDLNTFQEWFDFEEVRQTGKTEMIGQSEIVTQLHNILKPFLLRRLKTEVEQNLPPKKEYLLYAPLTREQSDIYKAIVNRDIRDYLVNKKAGPAEMIDSEEVVVSDGEGDGRSSKRLAKRPRINYRIEQESEDKFMRDVEIGVLPGDLMARKVPERTATDLGREWAVKSATKAVNNMKLQNMIMQLRKISSHPFLFDWPIDAYTGEHVVNEDLVHASGKMLLLQRLLDALFAKGHKVLLFSQFTTMLDVIEDWATIYKKWGVYRIDGMTKQADRTAQMDAFNAGGNGPDDTKLFLLSTRAGGLGVNLVGADTVIFFDQDWNPQADLQAQDRAHRIGQTKPVLIFRLVTNHTIETKILQSAGNKRKLEAMVISKGKFSAIGKDGEVLLGREAKNKTMEEMAKEMLALDSEEITIATKDDRVISDEDLEMLLDRSPEAFAREQGWAAGLGGQSAEAKQEKKHQGDRTAFEVFAPNLNDGNADMANLFSDANGSLP